MKRARICYEPSPGGWYVIHTSPERKISVSKTFFTREEAAEEALKSMVIRTPRFDSKREGDPEWSDLIPENRILRDSRSEKGESHVYE